MKILVAEDTRTNLAIITAILVSCGHEIIPASSGEEALQLYKKNRPDLVLLDVVMEGMDGYECARLIRGMDKKNWIPIIFLSASVEDSDLAKGIDAGGDDYLTKPFSEMRLVAKIKAMERIAHMRKKLFEATEQLKILSYTDRLTGLYNRLQFEEVIQDKIAEAAENHYIFSILYVDLDKFKLVNDTLGHHIGDLLLQEVADRLRSTCRINDFIARMGGDEFVIILEHLQKPSDAGKAATEITKTLSKEYVLEKHTVTIGASIGIVVYPSMGKTDDELMRNADIAMYKAKEQGRNNYQFFRDPLDIHSNS